MKRQFIISIKAEDRPGLLHLVTGMIERKLLAIKSLSAASADVHGILLITIEVHSTESDLAQLALKLENIIEVFAVQVTNYNQAVCLRAACFKMAKAFLETPQVALLQQYGAVIINWYPDVFLLAKYGTDTAIRHLYNELEGPHLLGFIQSGLIADTKLMDEDQSSVIRLAA